MGNPSLAFILRLLIVSIFIPVQFTKAQPDTLWTRKYGGYDYDLGYSVIQTTEGGFAVAGYTASYGAGLFNLWLIKTNSLGDTIWTRTVGGNMGDGGRSIVELPDEGYLIAGTTASSGAGSSDFWLVKMDVNGDTVWTKTYGGNTVDGSLSLLPVSNDTGYVIVGYTKSFGMGGYDLWLIRTDVNGDTLWTRTYGGSSDDKGRGVLATNDGGYLIIGTTESFGAGGVDIWIVRTDTNGDTLWTQTYGGMEDESGDAVQLCADGGFILAGSTESFGSGLSDFWLVRTDVNGDTLWTRTYGGSNDDVCRSAQSTVDGGYILAGSTQSFGAGGFDLWLVKTDDNGDTLWTRTIGGYADDYGHCVRQTADEGFIVTGHTHTQTAGYSDIWLVRLGPDVPVTTKGQPHTPSGFTLSQNYPNPFNPSTTIQFELPKAAHVDITIYSILGEVTFRLVDGYLERGYHKVVWGGKTSDGLHIPSGIYIARLVTPEYTKSIKMVLLK